MSTHKRYVCKHGKMMGQCRCASAHKTTIMAECRPSCTADDPVLYTGAVGSVAIPIAVKAQDVPPAPAPAESEPVPSFEELFSGFKTETPLTVEGLLRIVEAAGEDLRAKMMSAETRREQETYVGVATTIGILMHALKRELDSR